MTLLKALALQHLAELRERNKTNKNIQFGDEVRAALMFTYCDGTQDIVAAETVNVDDLNLLLAEES